MSRSRHRAVYVFSGVLLGVLVLGTIGAAAALDVHGRSATGEGAHEAVTAVEVRQECAGEVTLVPADAGTSTVHLSWSDRWTFDEPVHEAVVAGGRLVVTARCPGPQLLWNAASDLSVRVPDGVPVAVDAGAGAVRAEATSGDLRVHTGAGRIEVEDVAGRLDLRSGAGEVQVTGAQAEEVTVETGAGDVAVSAGATVTRVTVQTGAGEVEVELPDDGLGYAVRSRSGTGDVSVDVPDDPAAPRSLDLSSGAGDITVRTAG